MPPSSVHHNKELMVPDILKKVYRYGVTSETAQKVVLGTWPGTDRAGAERLAKAAGASQDALIDFWRATCPAQFLAWQLPQAGELYMALAYLGFRPELVDHLELCVPRDAHVKSLLGWGVMLATLADAAVSANLKCGHCNIL